MQVGRLLRPLQLARAAVDQTLRPVPRMHRSVRPPQRVDRSVRGKAQQADLHLPPDVLLGLLPIFSRDVDCAHRSCAFEVCFACTESDAHFGDCIPLVESYYGFGGFVVFAQENRVLYIPLMQTADDLPIPPQSKSLEPARSQQTEEEAESQHQHQPFSFDRVDRAERSTPLEANH